MAVMMVMRWSGVTVEQYEEARKVVNWEGDVPPGLRYQVSAFSPEGLRVVDVWDSAEQFQQFVGSRLAPGTAQIGIQGQPEVEILPAYLVFAPPA